MRVIGLPVDVFASYQSGRGESCDGRDVARRRGGGGSWPFSRWTYVGRRRGERLGHRDVGPEAAGQDQLEAAAEAGARAQDLAAAVLFDEAGIVEARPLAVEVELEQRGVRPEPSIARAPDGASWLIR